MSTNQDKITPFDYSGGRDFTDRLLIVTGAANLVALSDLIDVPRTTISTWHRRNMTAYEVAVRICISTGASLKYVVLGEGEPFEDTSAPIDTSVAFTKEFISNGVLTENSVIKLDKTLLDYYKLEAERTRLVELDNELMLINTSETTPTTGRYLIDIDGAISINHLQRLPGKKLAMSFGDSSIEVAENDITVLGKVVMVMGKA
ncbi:helix-turn-helix domain-containing protein [Photobacterium sanguinicancri]|uniref:helix-turn-helix domain-containing protein n=1 Tax=Photobacterium sanguinicancri TaxID=875932 RepID=UPI00248042D5|nr:helix-turn-helix domain-containing protein [Photobacterium sanguinicancri]